MSQLTKEEREALDEFDRTGVDGFSAKTDCEVIAACFERGLLESGLVDGHYSYWLTTF